jgi:hypothetical protein
VQVGRSSPFWCQFAPPPFLECEDASTLSCYRCQHSESIELNTLEVIHKAERLDRERIEEIIRENDSSSPMR